jgi:hypothetical protein
MLKIINRVDFDEQGDNGVQSRRSQNEEKCREEKRVQNLIKHDRGVFV